MTSPRTALLIDFGSTYTKLRAVDVDARRLLGTGQGPSTVTTDIMRGLHAALADLDARLGGLPRFQYRLASSSAAGGLRMVTVGLVRELTAEAARRAALGAGARLVGTFAYRLTAADLRRIAELRPDVLLLAGGTDGGNSAVVLDNARALGASALACPVVYAGNRAAADEACALMSGQNVIVTENVMPEFNALNIEPARAAIRRVFIDRIVHAKGIDRAQAEIDAVLMPTPVAVMEGARLLADGCGGIRGLGELLVVDPGGATTDVHSIALGAPRDGVVPQGLPEARVKRTVEGDLGMRHNAAAIAEAAGVDRLAARADVTTERMNAILAGIACDVERLPRSADETAADHALACSAVDIAVTRHCGTVETVYTPTGPVTVQHGKDLTGIATVVGTGGVIAAARDPGPILRATLADPARPFALKPRAPRLLIDRDYLLYACGLLSTVEPQAALELALTHLVPLSEELSHERARSA